MVELAGEVAFEAADNLGGGLAFGAAAGDVGAGGSVPAQPDDGDAVEGGVGLEVAAAVEPVSGGLAGGGGDRAGAADGGEGGFRVQPMWVVAGGDE